MAEGTDIIYGARLNDLSVHVIRNARGGAAITFRDRFDDVATEDFGSRQLDELADIFFACATAVRNFSKLKRLPDGTLHPYANLIREAEQLSRSRVDTPVLCDGVSTKEASL